MHNDLPQIIPNTYIETAEYDCLRDEGILYGKRLSRSEAKVEINQTRGTIHGYDSALNTQIAMSNIQKRILFLKKGSTLGESCDAYLKMSMIMRFGRRIGDGGI